MDSVKPLDKRRGWMLEQLAAFNQERFGDLVSAGWDLVVIDEAHRLGGSSDQVARYKLGQGLAEASPYLLLLSATPHQGKTDAFYRLIALLDAEAFPTIASVKRERVQLPFILDEYLIQQLRRKNQFQYIPLDKILPEREAFFEFLQSQWLHFIQKQISKARLTAELAGKYGNFPQLELSLDHKDIRVYIDNLFLEGHLKAIAAHDLNLSSTDLQPVPWITTGISVNLEAEQEERLTKLIRHLTNLLPAPEANHRIWLSFAPRWAELLVLRSQASVGNVLDVLFSI